MALRRLSLCLGLCLAFAVSAHAGPRLERSASFDWDVNTVVMNTKVYLRAKRTGRELPISAAEFAREVEHIGKSGPFAGYVLDRTPGTGSFRDSSDRPGKNLFLRDLRRSLAARGWQGPSWKSFVASLATQDGARRTTIITARGQSSETLYAGMKYLRDRGYIRNVPQRDNLFAVGQPGLMVGGRPLVGDTPERKLVVQRHLLDALQAKSERDGVRREFTFSDDEWANFEAAKIGLRKDVDAGRWPGVRVTLRYTGDDPAHRRIAVSFVARKAGTAPAVPGP